MTRKITVLIVDDSALIRQMLTVMLSSDPDIMVVGAAPDPLTAREMIKRLNPDVLTLDIEMPKMDGLAFLEKIIALRPMPVVMISSLTQKGADVALQALEIGAIDYIPKPTSDIRVGLEEKQAEIIAKVKAAAGAQVQPRRPRPDISPAPVGGSTRYRSTEQLIMIGSSTGGVEALKEVITALPPDCPAVMVTQHMPGSFTQSFADRLNRLSRMTVCEASPNQRVLPGHVYIAPGGRHLEVARSGANYICHIHDGPLVSGHRPSVDVLFQSAARVAGANAVGVILTGMGRDGAEGLLAMRQAGASTLGQDKASSVVYGMPRAAFEAGAVQHQYTLTRIAEGIFGALSGSDIKAIRV
ncbi:protein-glutamate methylesterase/protein-glutamine glutaminase [Sneathiella chinensis]|uniref:Protein-glutamate methylesterase/protein-glutamine glutaminase n=1 Tax=Sneathiella chinensis TaxID=349750 RepID=A0ABQ5U6L7_9PROT|nr:chemotaxis response regulator protein-glutamate methylesterase [Sneathiella chinensis]GLQ06957.1 chemotaxis response regulator protein-glutamate methylesterase of group 1 operon [Sneathiella chinensis]